MAKLITGEMTGPQIEKVLRERGVSTIHTDLRPEGGATASLKLHALRGPEGHVHTPTFRGIDVADALDQACAHVDLMVKRGVAVRDADGRLRGLYPTSDDGRRLAEMHMRSIGRGASVKGCSS